jgi:hypothetical protein
MAWHPLVRHRVLPGFVPSILEGDIAIVSEAMLRAPFDMLRALNSFLSP